MQDHCVQPCVAGLISKIEVQLRGGIGSGCAKVDYVLTPIAAYRDGAIDPEVVNVAAILNHGKPDRTHGIGLGPELEPVHLALLKREPCRRELYGSGSGDV